MSTDNTKGLVLAFSSSFFIGASFIIKKKGLKKAAASGLGAGIKRSHLSAFYSIGFQFFLVFWICF